MLTSEIQNLARPGLSLRSGFVDLESTEEVDFERWFVLTRNIYLCCGTDSANRPKLNVRGTGQEGPVTVGF